MDKNFDIIEQYKNIQDPLVLERVFEIYKNKLIGFICGYVYDYRIAEDIMMDVFVCLIKAHPSFETVEQLTSYLYKCSKNMAINYMHKNKRYVALDNDILQDSFDLEKALAHDMKSKKIFDAMNKLKTNYKQTIYLSYFAGMNNNEIAQILETNERAVKNLKHRAKKKLNSILKKENFIYEEEL